MLRQVCRLAFELMQLRYVDAAFRARSLDDPFYYGGGQREVLRAWAPYTPREVRVHQVIWARSMHAVLIRCRFPLLPGELCGRTSVAKSWSWRSAT